MNCGIISAARRRSGGGGSGPSSKWRVNLLTKKGGAAGNWGITEMEMRATVGGADQCSGGTALASATLAGSSAANAFDNNSGTNWDSGTTSSPQWIEYDFPTNVDVGQLAYLSSGLNGVPTSLNVQYYDSGTSSWVTYWLEDTFWVSTGAPTYLFSKPDPLIPGSSRWRLKLKSTQGGSSFCGFTELEFRGSAGGADLTVAASADGGNPFGDNTPANPQNVFDNSTATNWNCGFHPTSGSPGYIGYRFPTQQVVNEVAINITGVSTNGAPTSFDVEYLDTTTGLWTVAWSVASTGTWVASETKVFTRP